MCDRTHTYWRPSSGFYRALWQKRPIILRSLPIVATPYMWPDSLICVTELAQTGARLLDFIGLFCKRDSCFQTQIPLCLTDELYKCTNESRHIDESVMSHMNKSCPIWRVHVPHKWVVSRMNINHVTNKSRHVQKWWYMSFISEMCDESTRAHITSIRDVICSWRDLCSYVTRLTHLNYI